MILPVASILISTKYRFSVFQSAPATRITSTLFLSKYSILDPKMLLTALFAIVSILFCVFCTEKNMFAHRALDRVLGLETQNH